MDLKWVTMSILFSFLALIARQRIHCLVSTVGSARAAGFNCRLSTLSSIWAITSAASQDWDRMAFRTPSGRTSDFSLVWKKEKKPERITNRGPQAMSTRIWTFYTFCCSLRENTHSFAWKGDQQREDTFISVKKRTFAHKTDSITIFAF